MFEEFDKSLIDRFFEGLAMGMGAVTISFVFVAFLFFVMY